MKPDGNGQYSCSSVWCSCKCSFTVFFFMRVVPGSAHSQTYPINQINYIYPTMAGKLFSTKCIPGKSYRLNLCLLASNMIINKSQGGTFRFSEWAVIFSGDYNVLPSRALQFCVCVSPSLYILNAKSASFKQAPPTFLLSLITESSS